MSLIIQSHEPGTELGPFLEAAREVYRNDPRWVPPLDLDMRERLTPEKNPFFDHANALLFTAVRDGKLVGRISAQVDWEHQRRYNDQVGFFGFFDTVDDPKVGQALLNEAERWLAERGMTRVRGPLSLSINEEVGMLVEGFDAPTTLLNNYAQPHQATIAEACGLQKIKDVFGWHYQSQEIPQRAVRAWEAMQGMDEVKIRSVRRRHMQREVDTILEVFNDAWSDNWGFVPATKAEARKMAADLRLLIDPDLSYIVEIEQKPAGILVCIPNLNEVIHDFDGKLGAKEIAKLLYRLKVKHPQSARLIMLGLRKEARQNKRYAGLAMALYVELTKRGVAKGYRWGELGWTLEDNTLVNLACRGMGAKVAKRYRIFEKEIQT